MAQRLPPLATLRPFEAAARLESFSRAAEELHLTHGAVSHQVRALEEHLGTALFHRHGKRVSLTVAGRAYADRIRAALAEIARASEQARGGRRSNRLTVSVLPSFASRWLMPRLIRFMDANPAIEVNVMATNALANFAAEEVDVAIRYGRGPWPPLKSEKVADDEYFTVASPKFNKSRLPKTFREMLGVRLIREDRDYWKEYFEAAGIKVDAPLGGPSFNDASHSILAAARGEGIALTRRSLVGDDLERGALVKVFPLTIPSPESYHLVWPPELDDDPKILAFRAWVKAELKR